MPYLISIQALIYHGDKLISSTENFVDADRGLRDETRTAHETKRNHIAQTMRWYEWLEFKELRVSQLPYESRICFNVICHAQTGERQIVGTTTLEIFDHEGKMQNGVKTMNLWPFYKSDDRLACMLQYFGVNDRSRQRLPAETSSRKDMERFLSQEYARLSVILPQFNQPVQYTIRDRKQMQFLGFPGIHKPEHYRKFIDTPSTTDLAKLQSLLQQDPLNRNKYKPNDKDILIKCRSHYKSLPHGLQIFLTIIDWTDPEQVVQAHKMIRQWILLPPDEALPMLDARYPDEIVRLYAVERLTSFTDDELSLFMI